MKAALASVPGCVLFAWPFLGLGLPPDTPALVLALASVLGLGLVEIGTRELDSRRLALLAALAAIDAGLRAVVVTGIGGFSPIFFLVLCAGFVFGPSYGFLVGATSLLVSAIATGGVGSWVPYQLFASGCVGMLAGVVGLVARQRAGRYSVVMLALVGVITGYAFGALMDIWDWTFFRGASGLGWVPGLPAAEAASRFARFYLVTSLAYDSFRAAGNAVLILALGPAVIAALARFRARLSFTIVSSPAPQ